MKKSLVYFGVLFFSLAIAGLISCEKEEEKKEEQKEEVKIEWTIYVYGRPGCGFCSSLMNGLDSEDIPYTFYNIDEEPEKSQEMWDKLNAAGMGGGSVGLPVVDVEVDGVPHIFIRPDIEEDIKPLIQG